jgi:hypothetical protein
MFGIAISAQDFMFQYDLNGPRRYFDVTIAEAVMKFGVFQSLTPVKNMVRCTDEHWSYIPGFV